MHVIDLLKELTILDERKWTQDHSDLCFCGPEGERLDFSIKEGTGDHRVVVWPVGYEDIACSFPVTQSPAVAAKLIARRILPAYRALLRDAAWTVGTTEPPDGAECEVIITGRYARSLDTGRRGFFVFEDEVDEASLKWRLKA